MSKNSLEVKIKNLIGLLGPIGIDTYMQVCLYDTEYGYYRVQKPIGEKGDFITAPEISQMFGEIIGVWLYLVWQNLGRPKTFRLLELGPGRATLLIDTLRSFRALAKANAPKIEVFIAETNINLIKTQKEKLTGENVKWFNNLADFQKSQKANVGAPLIVLANEFFDCLPIKQYARIENIWHERQIGLGKNGELFVGLGPPIPSPSQLKEGETIFEFAPELAPILESLFGTIKAHKGAMLLLDYGYYNEYSGDTLQALYRHEKVGIFDQIGYSDLTSHVNFGAIEKIAKSNNISNLQIETQREFLLKFGIAARKDALIKQNPHIAENIERDFERLTHIDQMGELFKVFAFYELPSKE